MLLEDRVAIITGGARGIGKGIASRFAAEGCSVVMTDVAKEDGERAAEAICAAGMKAIFRYCDVTDSRQVTELFTDVMNEYGRVDILINNAGGVFGPGMCTENITDGDWDKVVDLNLKSQFLCCRAVIPLMKEWRYGRIVNLSSMGAVGPCVSISHYHAAKGGVLGLTTNLAYELAPFNICVNAIVPGPIRSEFYGPVVRDSAEQEALFADISQTVPLGRMGTPEDIAGAALFFASELSSYVTGESIRVGGGHPLGVCAR